MSDAQGPPLPTRQIMSQWWRDIAFVHWPVEPARVAPMMPAGVRPDTYDGAAWVGLIPFRMVDGGLGTAGPVPYLGSFLETNVRLYSLDEQGRHGVVFRSLEAERLAVVLGANATFRVPYRWARMSYAAGNGRVCYRTTRLTPRPASSRPRSLLELEVGDPIDSPSGLELFLTARFGLHTSVLGRTVWVPNTHGPWPLRRAAITALDDQLVAAAGLPGVVDTEPGSVLFSSGVRTVFGLPRGL